MVLQREKAWYTCGYFMSQYGTDDTGLMTNSVLLVVNAIWLNLISVVFSVEINTDAK